MVSRIEMFRASQENFEEAERLQPGEESSISNFPTEGNMEYIIVTCLADDSGTLVGRTDANVRMGPGKQLIIPENMELDLIDIVEKGRDVIVTARLEEGVALTIFRISHE